MSQAKGKSDGEKLGRFVEAIVHGAFRQSNWLGQRGRMTAERASHAGDYGVLLVCTSGANLTDCACTMRSRVTVEHGVHNKWRIWQQMIGGIRTRDRSECGYRDSHA